jgi:hypothetical protein
VKNLRCVHVVFLDHYSGPDDWKDIKEIQGETFEHLVCESVGWVVAEDDERLTLVANLNGKPVVDDQLQGFGTFHILKSAIVSCRTIRTKRGRK